MTIDDTLFDSSRALRHYLTDQVFAGDIGGAELRSELEALIQRIEGLYEHRTGQSLQPGKDG